MSSLPRLRPPVPSALADPVLRILVSAALVNALGRGVFLTLSILYLTLSAGLSTTVVAVVLTIASGVGVLTSVVAGHLADRVSARLLLVALVAVEGCALIAFTSSPAVAVVAAVASVTIGANRASNAVRSAIVARAFEGAARAGTRAILRTAANLGIAVGSAAAGVPVLIDTAAAYRVAFLVAGCITLAGAVTLLALPRSLDARPASPAGVGPRATAPLGRSPFRDSRYLALTLLAGVFAMQFGVAEVGLPIWVVSDTRAPHVIVSIALIVNTAGVILLQIPLSRGSEDLRRAGSMTGLAGALMAAACVAYGGSAGVVAPLAVALLLAAVLLHTFAEILSSAGTWSLSFELADRARPGAYQGVFAMGFSLGSMLAPLVVTATALDHGMPGWITLAAVFLGSALGVRALTRSSVRMRSSLPADESEHP
ncbi:MFS transporter [Leifsonia aquatica]|uniref:MFS transporter n=1 Tax=Leifsonia aquatica TaxID=144185 RepID=UPI003811F273